MRCLRSAGMMYAGFSAARRPVTATANARTVPLSSFSATNSARKLQVAHDSALLDVKHCRHNAPECMRHNECMLCSKARTARV